MLAEKSDDISVEKCCKVIFSDTTSLLRVDFLMQVVFHLQTRNPPILPPICQLFDQQPGAVTERPLHAGLAVTPDLIQV